MCVDDYTHAVVFPILCWDRIPLECVSTQVTFVEIALPIHVSVYVIFHFSIKRGINIYNIHSRSCLAEPFNSLLQLHLLLSTCWLRRVRNNASGVVSFRKKMGIYTLVVSCVWNINEDPHKRNARLQRESLVFHCIEGHLDYQWRKGTVMHVRISSVRVLSSDVVIRSDRIIIFTILMCFKNGYCGRPMSKSVTNLVCVWYEPHPE
jgi:hypothetical protein